MEARGKVVFIVGTGTDVGKTHVTCALISRAKETATVSAWKPVATGIAPGSAGDDVLALQAALGAPIERPMYAFAPPISPHLAARREGVSIDIDALAARAGELARGAELLFVESAGGLFSPLANDGTNADLASALQSEIGVELCLLVVAPDRVGVLHDLGATVGAARARGLALPVVALSQGAPPDETTGTNAAEIERLRIARQVIVFPRGLATDPGNRAAALACLRALEAREFLAH